MSEQSRPSEQRPLVVFAEDWGAHPSSTQHLIKVLSQQRKIIWINSIGLRKPRLSWRDILRVSQKIISFLSTNKQKSQVKRVNSPRFTVINPLVLPCAESGWTVKLCQWFLAKQLVKPLTTMAIHDPIIWCSLPTAVDYLALFKGCPSIYYCGDDFASLAGVDHQQVVKKEQQLVSKVRYIFTASQALLAKFPEQKSVTIPHGVNYKLFNKKQHKKPDDLPAGQFIAGFYGSISTWIDQELIVHASKLLPHWQFVFVGQVECNVDRLMQMSNIHFIGPKNHEQLPAYIQHWNVALLPFKNNQQIKMCNPLKLREYLASGTPIVSTDFPALKPYKAHVMTVTNKQDIGQAILMANANLTGDIKDNHTEHMTELKKNSEVVACRTHSVANESWYNRAQQVEKYLTLCYPK
jgi:glycosyltransferase involved in cell wall biosynthesis